MFEKTKSQLFIKYSIFEWLNEKKIGFRQTLSLNFCFSITLIKNLSHFSHGEKWRSFRSKVQRPILQPQTVKKYVAPIETVTEDFIKYMENARDGNGDLPHEFDNDIHRWSLECKWRFLFYTSFYQRLFFSHSTVREKLWLVKEEKRKKERQWLDERNYKERKKKVNIQKKKTQTLDDR